MSVQYAACACFHQGSKGISPVKEIDTWAIQGVLFRTNRRHILCFDRHLWQDAWKHHKAVSSQLIRNNFCKALTWNALVPELL